MGCNLNFFISVLKDRDIKENLTPLKVKYEMFNNFILGIYLNNF